VTEGTADTLRDLVAEKVGDPVAAAAGACAPLRLGDLERLELSWTRNLADWFPWLPDGAAVHGEHLARLGEHAEAARRFVEVVSRGLPVFATAFFFAFERLQLYSLKTPTGFDRSAIEGARRFLERFARDIDPIQPITTFPGVDPNRPSRAEESRPPKNGLGIAVA